MQVYVDDCDADGNQLHELDESERFDWMPTTPRDDDPDVWEPDDSSNTAEPMALQEFDVVDAQDDEASRWASSWRQQEGGTASWGQEQCVETFDWSDTSESASAACETVFHVQDAKTNWGEIDDAAIEVRQRCTEKLSRGCY